jgi:hypothetical protein
MSVTSNNGSIISANVSQWRGNRRLLGEVGLHRKISRAGLRLRFSRSPSGPQYLEAAFAISAPCIVQKLQRLGGCMRPAPGWRSLNPRAEQIRVNRLAADPREYPFRTAQSTSVLLEMPRLISCSTTPFKAVVLTDVRPMHSKYRSLSAAAPACFLPFGVLARFAEVSFRDALRPGEP